MHSQWHALSREEQAKYYELARKERQLHMQMYPGWSARDNYAQSKKKKRKRMMQQQQRKEMEMGMSAAAAVAAVAVANANSSTAVAAAAAAARKPTGQLHGMTAAGQPKTENGSSEIDTIIEAELLVRSVIHSH